MTFLAAILIAMLQTGFTWTLYEGEGPLVLANEVPDTPQLKTVLECVAGSGVTRVDLYGSPPGAAGIATIVSGSATATGESETTDDHRSVALRTDHPVFGQFVATGTLEVTVAGRAQTVAVEAAHRGKLRRFAELCAG